MHHIQLLVGKYLEDDLQLNITTLHEFTDDCVAQYKSRHCIGDLSSSLADFGFTIQRNFFETSHAKDEQDTTGSHVKQQASLAVVHGTASINAKDLSDHLTSQLSKPSESSFPSCSKSVSLNRRIFYAPSKGPDAILCNREGHKFLTVRGIHTGSDPVTVARVSSTTLMPTRTRNWLMACRRSCYTDTTQAQSETPMTEPIQLHVADLVGKDSIVAIAADKDGSSTYYLLDVTSEGPVQLRKCH